MKVTLVSSSKPASKNWVYWWREHKGVAKAADVRGNENQIFFKVPISLIHFFCQCLKPVVDYLPSLLEHLTSRMPALPRWVCTVTERACLPHHPSCVWGWERRRGGEPEKLGGEWLRPRQPPRCSWQDGEELMERCSEEELRGEALELRWWRCWAAVGPTNTCFAPMCLGEEQLGCGEWRGELACISWAKHVSRSESLLQPARILYRRSLGEKSNEVKLHYNMQLIKK